MQRAGERDHRVVIEGGGYPRMVRDDATDRTYLIYARAEGLLAAPFDVERLAITGPSVRIVGDVITNLSGGAQFDVAGGTLAYVQGAFGESDRDLQWVTLDGTATLARRLEKMGRFFSVSPDATRILRNNTVGARDVWIEDLVRGTSTRVTNSADNFFAVWSRDAEWIVFSRGAPIGNLYRRVLKPGAIDERLTTSPNSQEPCCITRDGMKIVYTESDPVSSVDIRILDMAPTTSGGTPQSRTFLKTNFAENFPALSPNDRWLAYHSNESGRFEVYVRSFPDGGPAVQVSTEGGMTPRWAPDGSLLYRAANGMLTTVPVIAGADFRTGPSRALFNASRYEVSYGIAPDGKRLLMMPLTDLEQAPTAISLVQNFVADLRQRVK